MATPCLTLLEATGIQPFIYGSNRLQENIGASEQVYRSTTMWAFAVLSHANLRHNANVENIEKAIWQYDKENEAANRTYDVEFVYASGGKALLIFEHGRDAAVEFTRKLTQRVLREAPGLHLAVQHIDFDWKRDNLKEKLGELHRLHTKHKQARLTSMPLLGLGVTAVCESTGLVAVRSTDGMIEIEGHKRRLKLKDDEETRFVSRESAYKLGYRDLAQERLKEQFGDKVYIQGFKFPSDMDNLGRELGEESYVAVVHADGNNMGQQFKGIGEGLYSKDSKDDFEKANREYVSAYRKFSLAVSEAAIQALRTVIDKLVDQTKWDTSVKNYLIAGKVFLSDNLWFPVRPLVFGGDDVTFLCNAQLGVSLAVEYLQEFEKQAKKICEKDLFACAGIAMVKMHYPFARAYSLSAQLCSSAKKYLRKEKGIEASGLDWHFATSGLSGSLASIRQREYTVASGRLNMRPLLLRKDHKDQSGRYWLDGVEQILHKFQEEDGEWALHRNKLIGLRTVLRQGPDATEKYRKDFELPDLHELLSGTQAKSTGWSGNQCVYFDAIELLDHYVPLD